MVAIAVRIVERALQFARPRSHVENHAADMGERMGTTSEVSFS